MNINLHIERLILDGLPMTRSQGVLVQAAVEAELGHLLTTEGLSPGLRAGGAIPSLRGTSIQLTDRQQQSGSVGAAYRPCGVHKDWQMKHQGKFNKPPALLGAI